MSPARWLIVVQRDRPEIYADFRQSFELDERVEVILDDRQADRRVQRLPVKGERRRRDRRKPLPGTESAFAQHAGFFLLVRDDDRRPVPRSRARNVRTRGRRR